MKPHRFVRRPSPASKRRIEDLFRRGPGHRVRRRANAVRLSAMGYTVPQITEVLVRAARPRRPATTARASSRS